MPLRGGNLAGVMCDLRGNETRYAAFKRELGSAQQFLARISRNHAIVSLSEGLRSIPPALPPSFPSADHFSDSPSRGKSKKRPRKTNITIACLSYCRVVISRTSISVNTDMDIYLCRLVIGRGEVGIQL